MKYSGMIPNQSDIEQDGLLSEMFWQHNRYMEFVAELNGLGLLIKEISDQVYHSDVDVEMKIAVNNRSVKAIEAVSRINNLVHSPHETLEPYPGINLSNEKGSN